MSYLLTTKKTLNQINGGQKGANYNSGIKVKDKPVQYNIGVKGKSKGKPACGFGLSM
jgi:hypothetical protein